MGKLCKQNPRAYTIQPSHDFADLLSGPVYKKNMNMVARYFTRNDVQLIFHGNLAQNISGTGGYRP